MKFLPYVAAILLLIAALAACAPKLSANPPALATSPAGSAAAATMVALSAAVIAPEEAKRRLDSEPDIVLVDVREPDEYAQGHIKGSILLPGGSIEAQAGEKLPDKNAVIFVYCRSGRRSAVAAGQLAGMGYTRVYDMGGILDWPYGVEK